MNTLFVFSIQTMILYKNKKLCIQRVSEFIIKHSKNRDLTYP